MKEKKALTAQKYMAEVARSLRRSIDQNLAVGPVVWKWEGGRKLWYFWFVVKEKRLGIQIKVINCGEMSQGQSEVVRAEFVRATTGAGKPFLVHIFDDELDMAIWCDVIWPCDRFKAMIEDIRKERSEIGDVDQTCAASNPAVQGRDTVQQTPGGAPLPGAV